MLYLIEILHQTTTLNRACKSFRGLYLIEILHQTTTMWLPSMSRACCILSKFYIKPQQRGFIPILLYVVSYRNSTSNHNWKSFIVCNLVLYLIEILHQTTTCIRCGSILLSCILSKFYIKPQP